MIIWNSWILIICCFCFFFNIALVFPFFPIWILKVPCLLLTAVLTHINIETFTVIKSSLKRFQKIKCLPINISL